MKSSASEPGLMEPVKITLQGEIYFFQSKEKTETTNLKLPLDVIDRLVVAWP